MSPESTSIAIIGAGPAGLTLARLLLVSPLFTTSSSTTPKLTLTIFEKDPSPHARYDQGGTLDLHPATGLAAVKAMDLTDQVARYLRYDGEEMAIVDKLGTELIHIKDASSNNLDARPEIDRKRLQEILLESVMGKDGERVSMVRWGKQLASIDEATGVLTFKDSNTDGPFDLVVGADGAWSRVRPVLTKIRPHYSGVTGFELQIHAPRQNHPDLNRQVGRGTIFAMSDRKSLIAQRLGDDTIKVAAYTLREEGYAAQICGRGPDGKMTASQDEIKQAILELYADWNEDLTRWVDAATVVRPWDLYELHVGHRHEHKKGYTVLSDAAHLMTPFAGEGVNAGMKDSLELSGAIVSALTEGSDLDEAVKQFEEAMFVRGREVQLDTMRNKTAMFREDAPVGFLTAQASEAVKMFWADPARSWLAWAAAQPLRALAWTYFSSIVVVGRWTGWWKL